jgi:glycosyltransferase involved in cell wall biosynthesis
MTVVTDDGPGRRLGVLRASPRTVPLLGGQEIHVEELTRRLADMGIRQRLVFATGEGSGVNGVSLRHVRVPQIPGSIPRDLYFGLALGLETSRFRPEVIHTHGDAPVARGGHILASRFGSIHVHTFHSGLPAHFIRRFVLGRLLTRSTYYLAVSRGIAAQLVELGIPSDQVWVRPSGVRDAFLSQDIDVPRQPSVAVGGRLVPQRGILDFVRAWSAAGIEDVQLTVFGSGPEAESIGRIAKGDPRVRWLGALSPEQLADLLRRAAVGVVLRRGTLHTESAEGTPTLVLEMLASGCYPMTSPSMGETAKVIEDSGGFGDASGAGALPLLVAERARLLVDSNWNKRRVSALRYARKVHSWDVVAQQVAELYARLSQRGQRKSVRSSRPAPVEFPR